MHRHFTSIGDLFTIMTLLPRLPYNPGITILGLFLLFMAGFVMFFFWYVEHEAKRKIANKYANRKQD